MTDNTKLCLYCFKYIAERERIQEDTEKQRGK